MRHSCILITAAFAAFASALPVDVNPPAASPPYPVFPGHSLAPGQVYSGSIPLSSGGSGNIFNPNEVRPGQGGIIAKILKGALRRDIPHTVKEA